MFSVDDSLAWAHPLVHDWFIQKYGKPTEPQVEGWPSILAKQNTLISAPTGYGKTLAAFLICIDRLIRKALVGALPDQTEILYVSPLKALSNDVQKNLTEPLDEIRALANQRGLQLAEIHVAVRTGDTPAKERQRMLKKPPAILVTTPESLYILLTAEKSRQLLHNVKTVIVDEIHVLVNSKRGAHLAVTLEHLESICQHSPLRIGLSATQKPLDQVAQFLHGNREGKPMIVNIGHVKKWELHLEVPKTTLRAVATNEVWDEIVERVSELAKANRATLIFVNTRRMAERLAHQIREKLDDGEVSAHHGSLARHLRLEVETKLKQGELKVLVATASLELGIDVGYIDLVCQVGGTPAIATTLQRVGRAGHLRDAGFVGEQFALPYALESLRLHKTKKPQGLITILSPTDPLNLTGILWEGPRIHSLSKKKIQLCDGDLVMPA